MLEKLKTAAKNIHAIEADLAKRRYARAMIFLNQSADAFDGALDVESSEQVQVRLREIAEAAQLLAYVFYHQYHRPIADGAINPERFDYGYRPPSAGLPFLSRQELEPYLLAYLRAHLPHTLPVEMR